MRSESTFETAKRLGLGELKLGEIVEIIYKNKEHNPNSVFGKLLEIEFLARDVTWIRYVIKRNKTGDDYEMGTNLLYVEKIRPVGCGEILERLNNIAG